MLELILADPTWWHGRLMVLAWVILFPLGVLTARFLKILPGQNWPNEIDNTIWWRCHLVFQYAGVLCAGWALWLIKSALISDASAFNWHRLLGWITLGLLLIQVLSAWSRGSKGGPSDIRSDGSERGDHFDMTPRRRRFERVHKGNGYLVLVVAIATVLTGLAQVDAPVWMYATLIFWWLLLLLLFVGLQRAGLQMDTYQAIWGLQVSSRAPVGTVARKVHPHPWLEHSDPEADTIAMRSPTD